MSILTASLRMGRARTVARMTEKVRVGICAEHTDPTTGDSVRMMVSARYAGIGQILYPSLVVGEQEMQGQQVATTEAVLKLPAGDALDVCEGDFAYVEESSVDDELVGKWFRVKGPPQSGQVTAHRFPIEEVT